MKIKAIIFDFFGVICSEVSPLWFKKYFPNENVHELMEQYCGPGDRGEVSRQQFLENLANLINENPENVAKELNSFTIINEELVGLIKQLKGKVKLAICSDATEEFIMKIIDQHNLSQLFDTIVISSVVKVDKPNPQIFKITLDKLGVQAEDAIFIDDHIENVEAAQKLEIHSLLFSSVMKLKEDIKNFDIKVVV